MSVAGFGSGPSRRPDPTVELNRKLSFVDRIDECRAIGVRRLKVAQFLERRRELALQTGLVAGQLAGQIRIEQRFECPANVENFLRGAAIAIGVGERVREPRVPVEI